MTYLTERYGRDQGASGACLSVPLWAGAARYGVLVFYGHEPRAPLSRFEDQFLGLLGQWLNYELSQEAQREALIRQATQDPLTGAYTRPPFEARLEQALAHCRRYGTPAGLLLLDVDHFKAINDTHGHAVGDRCLRALVDRLRMQLREPDALARWGGEEFAVLVPQTAVPRVRLLAERLRECVWAKPLTEEIGPVSISVGVTLLDAGDTARASLERADRALYRAKAEGRNRVVTLGR
nr:GGDEF domain-containing protein [Halorhodospira halophila]